MSMPFFVTDDDGGCQPSSGPGVDGTKLATGRAKPANKPLERYRLDGVGRTP